MIPDVVGVLIHGFNIGTDPVALSVSDVVMAKSKDLFFGKGFSDVIVESKMFRESVGNEHKSPRSRLDIPVGSQGPIPDQLMNETIKVHLLQNRYAPKIYIS